MFGVSLFFSVGCIDGLITSGGAVLKRRAKIFRPYTAGNHEGCPYTSAKNAQITRLLSAKNAQITRLLSAKNAQITRLLSAKNAQITRVFFAFICVHLRNLRIQTPLANTPNRVRDRPGIARGDWRFSVGRLRVHHPESCIGPY